MAIARLGIVGSGIMGSGIAEVAAKAGIEVVLRSRKQETADAMLAGLGKSLDKQVSKGKLSEEEAAEAMRPLDEEELKHWYESPFPEP
jgi:3-hydroxybutyryl-CoA dehydrogenase